MEAYRILSKEDSRANYDAQYVRPSRFDHVDMDRERYRDNFHSHYNYAQEILKAREREKYYEE